MQEYHFIVTVASVENSATIATMTTPFTVNMLDDCDPTPDFAHTPTSNTINFVVDTDAGVPNTLTITAWAQNSC